MTKITFLTGGYRKAKLYWQKRTSKNARFDKKSNRAFSITWIINPKQGTERQVWNFVPMGQISARSRGAIPSVKKASAFLTAESGSVQECAPPDFYALRQKSGKSDIARDIPRAQALFLKRPDKPEIGKQPARRLAGFCFFTQKKTKQGRRPRNPERIKKEYSHMKKNISY